ncbi:hypothetical protein [Bradyrhizobium liaoningense]|uniref:hypothetical protein n=1 Tax=Bradyrhizobium liaoningense TaxID=43992 RepID=UPI001FE9C8DA|nr:hypothetical protein [Bradyrhizobium liaoningense]
MISATHLRACPDQRDRTPAQFARACARPAGRNRSTKGHNRNPWIGLKELLPDIFGSFGILAQNGFEVSGVGQQPFELQQLLPSIAKCNDIFACDLGARESREQFLIVRGQPLDLDGVEEELLQIGVRDVNLALFWEMDALDVGKEFQKRCNFRGTKREVFPSATIACEFLNRDTLETSDHPQQRSPLSGAPALRGAEDDLVLHSREFIPARPVDVLVGDSKPPTAKRRKGRADVSLVGPASQMDRILVGIIHPRIPPQAGQSSQIGWDSRQHNLQGGVFWFCFCCRTNIVNMLEDFRW